MPNRVKQHQLEDISIRLNLSLPREWVLRNKDKDYGIDAEVEIFDVKGAATGLVFLVQIKATETSEMGAARKVDLSIERIKYYKQLKLPVLIVRYSDKEDKFYCKWVYDIDLYYAEKEAKTIRIIFDEKDFWDSNKIKGTVI